MREFVLLIISEASMALGSLVDKLSDEKNLQLKQAQEFWGRVHKITAGTTSVKLTPKQDGTVSVLSSEPVSEKKKLMPGSVTEESKYDAFISGLIIKLYEFADGNSTFFSDAQISQLHQLWQWSLWLLFRLQQSKQLEQLEQKEIACCRLLRLSALLVEKLEEDLGFFTCVQRANRQAFIQAYFKLGSELLSIDASQFKEKLKALRDKFPQYNDYGLYLLTDKQSQDFASRYRAFPDKLLFEVARYLAPKDLFNFFVAMYRQLGQEKVKDKKQSNNLLSYYQRLKQPKLIWTGKGHTNWVTSASFSPCGNYIVSASEDNTLKLWQTKTGTCLWTDEEHTGSVESVDFSPCGRYLVSASYDKTLKLWQVLTHTNY